MFLFLVQDAFRPKNSPKVGDIWTTQSFISTNGKDKEYGILFAADIQGTVTVGIPDLNFNVVCTLPNMVTAEFLLILV